MRRRAVLLLTTAMTTALVAVLMASGLAWAQNNPPLVVNSTADTDDDLCQQPTATFPTRDCTLREAINAANSQTTNPGADTIEFNIPGSGVKTIFVSSPGLPTIREALTIDGYTQGDATQDTTDDAKENTLQAPGETDAVPLIQLDGTNAGNDEEGLNTGSAVSGPAVNNVVIRGLIINGFDGNGIQFSSGFGHKVEGNFIGTNAQGDAADPNGGSGVFFSNSRNSTVGGTAVDARNVISGNAGFGVLVDGEATGNKVETNLIGTAKNGTSDLGNGSTGVFISSRVSGTISNAATNNTVGGAAGAQNTIAFNAKDGVGVAQDISTANRILSNSIFENGELGIDLVGGEEDANGVTANDRKDRDLGPNNLQNSPEITSATISLEDGLTIKGKLKSTPKQTFTIQLFRTTQEEGKIVVGELTGVKTNRKGTRSFTFNNPNVAFLISDRDVTATATNEATDDTSEFSAAVPVSSS